MQIAESQMVLIRGPKQRVIQIIRFGQVSIPGELFCIMLLVDFLDDRVSFNSTTGMLHCDV